MHYFRLFLFLLVTACCVAAAAQQRQKKLSWNDQFIIGHSGKPFPVQESYATIQDKSYDFTRASRPAFVYISSESCLPCRFELPLYLEACSRDTGFDFVYFTTDPDTAAVREKFGKHLALPNLYVILRPYDYFYDRGLFLGFPTKYFIGSNRLVDTVQLGGYMVKEKVLEEWTPVLTRLH